MNLCSLLRHDHPCLTDRLTVLSTGLMLICALIFFSSSPADARNVHLLQLNPEPILLKESQLSINQRAELTRQILDSWRKGLANITIVSSEVLNDSLSEDFDPTSCGARCPIVIARAVRADVVVYGTVSQDQGQWRLHLKMSDVSKEVLILNKSFKASKLSTLSVSILRFLKKNRSQLQEKLSLISQRPLRIYKAEQATAPTHARWSELGITWIPISGSQFEMGHPSSHPSERPVHAVDVESFQMMKTEVTADQYWACVKAGVCSPTPERKGCVSLGPNAREAINCVTWLQARTFAEWIGARLPSEMEWELAAKGVEGRRYPWGNEPASCERLSYANKDGVEGCGDPSAQAPCTYSRGISPLGLCDLAGNLWEWVADDWHRDYRSAPIKGAWCESGRGLKKPCSPSRRTYKTYRGGSWYHPASRAQSTSRAGAIHSVESVGVGFRCAL